MATMGPARLNPENPLRRAWGMGPITSTASGEMKARIPLVPRM
jgi:hypothetical protein